MNSQDAEEYRDEALAIVIQRAELWRDDHELGCPEGADCPQIQSFDAALSVLQSTPRELEPRVRVIWTSWASWA